MRVDHSNLCHLHTFSHEDVENLIHVGRCLRQRLIHMSERLMTINLHTEEHYAEGVYRFGSLRESAVYGMESALGELKDQIWHHCNGKSTCEHTRLDYNTLRTARLLLKHVPPLPKRFHLINEYGMDSETL